MYWFRSLDNNTKTTPLTLFFIYLLFNHAVHAQTQQALTVEDQPEAALFEAAADSTSPDGTPFDIRSENDVSWLPGEYWDPLSGSISHHMRDIEYHGNNGIPIILSRTHKRSILNTGEVGFDIDVPTLHHNSYEVATSYNCNNHYDFEDINTSYTYFQRASGVYFVHGQRQIHFFDNSQSINAWRFPSNAILVSPDNWYITCESNIFHVHSNDGMSYKMGSAARSNSRFLVTKITDRFGNYLNYTYESIGSNPTLRRLKKIESNDGRELNFTNTTNGNIAVSSNGTPNPHTASYFYADGKLQVKREDNDTTRIQYDSSNRIIGIRYPTEGLVNYRYHSGTNEIKERKLTNDISGEDHQVTWFFTKHLSGSETSWTISTPLVKNRYTSRKSLIDKDNIGLLSGNVDEAQGKLIRFEQFENDGVPLESSVPYLRTEYVYQKDNSLADVVNLVNNYPGTNYPKSWISLFHAWKSRIKTATSYMKLGNGMTISATRTINSRDVYGMPEEIVESGTAGSRTITLQYQNLSSPWITGLTTKRTVFGTNDPENTDDVVSFTYDEKGRIKYRYDNTVALEHIYDSETDSLLSETKDGLGRQFTYDDYYRGIPRKIGRKGKSNAWEYKYRVVNSDGTIQSESRWSEQYTVWNYEYDAMRRTKKISSPRSETADIDINWITPNLVRTTQSNLETETRYDGFGRVVFEGSTDTSTYTNINVFRRYDKYGRLDFESIPATTSWNDYLSNQSQVRGTTYRYDNFDRMIRAINATNIGSEDYSYNIDGNANVNVKDKEDREQTTYYQYYGDFNNPVIEKISDGNSIDTVFTYDTVGKIEKTVRDNITRRYYYNNKEQLYKETHPETGSTHYWYGRNGMLTWEANNRPLGIATQVTRYQYDLANRLKKIRYGNGVAQHYVDQSFFYDKNGNLERVTSDGALSNDWIALDYTYDQEENLLSESLRVDDQNYTIEYRYDDLSGLRQRLYPTGNRYNYAPDAFGRPTQIISDAGKTILDSIEYYADGQVSDIENPGGTYRRTRNAIGYPIVVQTRTSNNDLTGYRYHYDFSGNIDQRDYRGGPSGSEYFTYDNNNRLLTANGPRIGGWSFVYDNRDNISNYAHDGTTTSLQYNGSNRLSKVGNKTVTYDGRYNINNNGVLWSGFNRADQIYQDGNGHKYSYDGHGLRVSEKFGDMTDYTFYDRSGVLRYRYGKKYQIKSEYHTVNGQLFARRDTDNEGGDNTGPGPCIDTDGDGWGWDGEKSCIP